MRIPIIFLFAIALSVVNAAEKTATNTTAGVTSTKDSREKRNLNHFGNFGASRRNDGYNYQPSGYNYEPSNYIGGGSAPSSNDFRNYPEPLEPIIEIIIQDNNETLPAPEPIFQANGKKKKEQVQVFYVKYHKDEKSGLVIHDPIPALSPASHNQEEEEYEDEPISIVTPVPQLPQRSTTLRTIIRPDSMQYESDSGVHVTFGSPHNHNSKSDNRIHDEEKVESALRPVVHLPQSRIGPVGTIKDKREQSQGRVVNSGPPANFHPPQQLGSNGSPNNFNSQHQSASQSGNNGPPSNFNPQHQSASQSGNHGPPANNFHSQQQSGNNGPPPNFHPELQSGSQSGNNGLQANFNPHRQSASQSGNNGPPPNFHPELQSGSQSGNNGLQANFNPHYQSGNNGPSPNFQPPQQLVQSPPFQRPHPEFNPQNNFVSPPNQGQLSHQLSLPSSDPSKPFHPNSQGQQQHQHLRPQQPQPIPVQHQQQNQFAQQNILGHQQFNQPPQRLPLPQPQIQQQPLLRPPQRPAVPANFNQNQKPFNYHAHATQQQSQLGQPIRFPSQPQPQQQFQGPPQNFPPNFQQLQNLQRPQPQQLPPRQGPPQSFQNNQQLPPSNRPPPSFNQRPSFPSQPQFPPNQGPPQNFRPNQEQNIQLHSQSLQQHNQQVHQQQQQSFEQNVFRGGLVQQNAPDLSNVQHRQQIPQQQFSSQEEAAFHQEQNNFIHNSFGSNVQVQSSVPKFEHHITETVNGPIFFQPTAVDMDKLQQEKNGQQQNKQHESQHRFAVNQNSQQHHVSNHFSEVFPQTENNQKQFSSQSFLELNGRNNFSPEPREPVREQPTARPSARPTAPPTAATTTTRRPDTSTTTRPAPPTTRKTVTYDLPDEVPDDLREQLLSSGILENAQISILDYDKVGDTPLTDLPAEHLANFFSAGGGAQIGASNKVISVLKPNGDSIEDRIKTLQNDRGVTKFLENSKKLPSKKEDVNLKVVKFDAQSQKNIHEQYIQKDSKILPSVNIDQHNYNRYLPLKINGAQFPIPDVEELIGKKITSVVVLAPVNANDDDSRQERDTVETKKIKFISGDSLKNLLRKPSSDNYKKWLEKEQKTNPDLQSVVLLVTNDSSTGEQEIFMYDIISKTVSRLSGELSSKFVDVAEENIFDDSTPLAEQIDRMDESIELLGDAEPESSEIVESVVKLDSSPVTNEQPENKIDISSGYSVIKNE